MTKHPFLDPESYLDYGVKIKDYKPKEKPAGLPPNGATHNPTGSGNITPPGAGVIGTGSIRKLLNGNFLFYNVPYQGRVIECIERPMVYVDGGNSKTQADHIKWLLDKKNNPEGFTLTDSELEYQLCRMSFDLRADSKCGAQANEYITKIRELYDSWLITADHIQYGNGLEAVITNKGTITSKPEKRLSIPTFKDNYSVLSVERPESQLIQTNQIDAQTNDFLKEYLGQGSERVGIIFPYCASRKTQNLRETRVWTPSDRPCERVGGLGGYGGRFSIGAVGVTYYYWRALVVAERKK